MEFKELLSRNRDGIRQKWHQLIVETYPADSAKFIASKKDRFSNPVGFAISDMVDSVLRCLVEGAGPEELSACLTPLVKIRAVQDFTPSQAVSFVFFLRHAVRGSLGEGRAEAEEALRELDSAVEDMALISFDIYAECREAISRVREDEMKRNLHMLLRKANVFDAREAEHG